MNIALILGYGVHLEGEFPYLDLIIPHLQSFDLIIPCGGFTNRDTPDISEALSIQKYLESTGIEKDFLLEDASLTTPENILNGKKLIDSMEGVESITIFCDSIRVPKITIQALQAFLGYSLEKSLNHGLELHIKWREKAHALTEETIVSHQNLTVHGVKLNRTPEEIGDQIIASLAEAHMVYDEKPRQRLHNWRRKLWKLDE
jgi:hypothetical protein